MGEHGGREASWAMKRGVEVILEYEPWSAPQIPDVSKMEHQA